MQRINDGLSRLAGWIEEFSSRTWFKRIILLVLICGFAGLSFYLFEPNLKATWWVQDDHEIVWYAGADQIFHLNEVIPTLLTRTELSPDSTLGRFRPAYYFLRLLETYFWQGFAPFGWYLARIIFFAFFMIVLAFFFARIHGWIIGALLALFSSSYGFWADIFARLGPSEAYAVLGVGFFMIGLMMFMRNKQNNKVWLWLTLGVILSVGSKENMLILLVPLAYVFIAYLRTSAKRKAIGWSAVIVSLGWSAWIVFNVFRRIGSTDTDIYSNSANLIDRVQVVLQYIGQQWMMVVPLFGLFVLGGAGWIFMKPEKGRNSAKMLTLGAACVVLLILSQVFFYFGLFEGRYFFPLFLFLPLTISLFVFVFQQYAKIRHNRVLLYLINLLAIVGLLVSLSPEKWQFIRGQSIINVQRSHLFMSKVEGLVESLSADPQLDLVFYGTNPGYDYEPIDSYERFIRAANVQNQFFILRDPPPNYLSTYSPLAAGLEKQLVEKAEDGDTLWTISPLVELNSDPHNCVLATLLFNHPAPVHCAKVIDVNVFLDYQSPYSQD